MKTCSKCKIEKPLSEFAKHARTKDGLQYHCQTCKHLAMNKNYQNNKEKYKLSARANQEELKRLVRDIKNVPCMDCGKQYHYSQMDFDHRPGEQKIDLVSKFVKNGARKKLLAEIDKCDIVCANCHRLRSWKRQASVAK